MALSPRAGWEIIYAGADRSVPQGLTSKPLRLTPCIKVSRLSCLNIKRVGGVTSPATCASTASLLRISKAFLHRWVGARPPNCQAEEPLLRGGLTAPQNPAGGTRASSFPAWALQSRLSWSSPAIFSGFF